MYNSFVNGLHETLVGAGYVRINMPAHVLCPGEVALWGRQTGSMTCFYVTYSTHAMDTTKFPEIKDFVDQCINQVTEKVFASHFAVFHIIVGDLDENINHHINQNQAYSKTQNDIYFGVDMLGVVFHHPKALVKTDKSLQKIEDTLGRINGTKPALKPPDPMIFAKPLVKIPFFAYTIIGVNVMIFVLMELTGGSQNNFNLMRFGAAQFYLTFQYGQFYRIFTPMFLHIGLWHLLSNTMWIVVAGIRAEKYLGHWKFLLIYLISGTIGNLAMMLSSPMAIGAGASGAVSGIFGALFAFMLVTKKRVENLDLKTMGTLIVVNMLAGFAINTVSAGGNVIANSAHLGGLITGFLLGLAATKWKA